VGQQFATLQVRAALKNISMEVPSVSNKMKVPKGKVKFRKSGAHCRQIQRQKDAGDSQMMQLDPRDVENSRHSMLNYTHVHGKCAFLHLWLPHCNNKIAFSWKRESSRCELIFKQKKLFTLMNSNETFTAIARQQWKWNQNKRVRREIYDHKMLLSHGNIAEFIVCASELTFIWVYLALT
jgi:hypothetical protein